MRGRGADLWHRPRVARCTLHSAVSRKVAPKRAFRFVMGSPATATGAFREAGWVTFGTLHKSHLLMCKKHHIAVYSDPCPLPGRRQESIAFWRIRSACSRSRLLGTHLIAVCSIIWARTGVFKRGVLCVHTLRDRGRITCMCRWIACHSVARMHQMNQEVAITGDHLVFVWIPFHDDRDMLRATMGRLRSRLYLNLRGEHSGSILEAQRQEYPALKLWTLARDSHLWRAALGVRRLGCRQDVDKQTTFKVGAVREVHDRRFQLGSMGNNGGLDNLSTHCEYSGIALRAQLAVSAKRRILKWPSAPYARAVPQTICRIVGRLGPNRKAMFACFRLCAEALRSICPACRRSTSSRHGG